MLRVNNEAIRARREAMAMTMQEAADRAGLGTRQNWNKVENGANPSAVALYRVSRVLGCTMETLITDAKPKKK